MPLALAAADRKLLLIFGAVLAFLLLGLAVLQPQQESGASIPSSYSAESGGAKAAYLLMKAAGYSVERWEAPPRQLPVRAGAVLILADPRWQADSEDKMALQRFLVKGGRVLATGMSAANLLPEGHTQISDPTKAGWGKYRPAIPSALTRAGEITMSPWVHWDKGSFAQVVHYGRGEEAVVVSYKLGNGEVIWWAASTPLTNAGIRESGNMELLLNSVGDPAHTHIYWDEYFHGSRPGPWAYVSDTPLRWALAQLGVFFLAVMLTFSRRSGPVRPLVKPSRLSPLEFVETLGGLYQSAHAAQVAVEVSYQRFQYLLGKQLGMPGRPSAAEMVRAVEQRLRYDRRDFAATLTHCETSIGDPDLREKEALKLVQALNDFSRDLQLVPGAVQEKN
jgi:Domain of unknown function (DUF4350)